MANPQKENGYTPIANDIMDALLKLNLSGQEWQILLAIIRKTYGWGKKQEYIPYSQFAKSTGIKRRLVYRPLKKLIFKNIVLQMDDGFICKYMFNKNFESWKNSIQMEDTEKNKNVHQMEDTFAPNGGQFEQKSSSKWRTSKENIKDTNKTTSRLKKSLRLKKFFFARNILKNKKEYPRKMLRDFYSWFTDTDGKIFRYEKDQVFDIEKQLMRYEISWRKRNFDPLPENDVKKSKTVSQILSDTGFIAAVEYCATMHDALNAVEGQSRVKLMDFFIQKGLTNDDFITKTPQECIRKMGYTIDT